MKEIHRFTDLVDLGSTTKVKESAHTLREGPGAGYTVTIEDLAIKSGTVNIVESTNEGISFTAELDKSDVSFRAEGYDWSVDSTDSNDINVAGTDVQGGRIAGFAERAQYTYNPDIGGKDVELTDEELTDYIETQLKSFGVNAMIGGGYFHSTLGETFIMEDNGNDILNGGGDNYGYVTVVKVEVESPSVAYSVENAYENRYEEFDESMENFDLAKWLEKTVDSLKENNDAVGAYHKIPGTNLSYVVRWEEGFGEEREGLIQAEDNPDWALCAAICITNTSDTCDVWDMPYDKESGEVFDTSTSLSPNESWKDLANWLEGQVSEAEEFYKTKTLGESDKDDEDYVNDYFDSLEANIINDMGADGDSMLESKKSTPANKHMTEAVDGGWEVKESEAREAYEFACERLGEEYINEQIVQAIGTDELAACLAFIFRMHDFREWDERNDETEEENYTDEFMNEIESDNMTD